MKKLLLCILMVVAAITMASCSYEANEVMQPAGNGKLQFVVSDFPAFGEAQTAAVAPLNMNVTDRQQATPMIVTLASTRNYSIQNCAIGTQDEGKTAWEEDDQIIVTLTSQYFGEQSAAITYDGTSWSTAANLSYLKDETPTVSAIYAPCYEVVNGKLQLKDGMQPGMTECIPAKCTFTNNVVNISFDGISRNYSRLRIAGMPNASLTITPTGFTPAGATSEATEAYTLTTDDKGNAYLYGTFAEHATVSVKQGEVTLKDYTFTAEKNPGGTEQGKSYALDARPIIDGTLGYKETATEDDINALVEQLKTYVANGITTITVTGSEPAMITVDNVTVTAIGEAIYRLSGSSIEENSTYLGKIDLILPDVTEIVDWEFSNAYALNSITLPKVTTVGDNAFYHCWYLQELTFGSVVTLIKSEPAFSDVGRYVDGGLCNLVLNAGQVNAEAEYQPNIETNVWWNTPWKHITLI